MNQGQREPVMAIQFLVADLDQLPQQGNEASFAQQEELSVPRVSNHLVPWTLD